MNEYPEMVTCLPQADIAFKGLQGWIFQGKDQQIVFMQIEPIGKVTEHAHRAQFGMALDGEMSLTIGGVTRIYRKGDTYFIPKGVPHSAVFHSKVFVVDFFDEPTRYKEKS